MLLAAGGSDQRPLQLCRISGISMIARMFHVKRAIPNNAKDGSTEPPFTAPSAVNYPKKECQRSITP